MQRMAIFDASVRGHLYTPVPMDIKAILFTPSFDSYISNAELYACANNFFSSLVPCINLGQIVCMTYFALRLNAGVIIASPTLSGANFFAAASSSFPAALCIAPETPLPASKDGWAEKTIMSASALVMSPISKSSLVKLFVIEIDDGSTKF